MTILTKQPLSLFHFDTDLLDTSGKVWTQIGNPVVSSSNAVFGGGSLKLTPSDGLSLLTHNLDVGEDFTVSWREYLISTPTNSGGGIAINYGYIASDNYAAGLLLGHNYEGKKTIFCGSGVENTWDLINFYNICSYNDVLGKWVHYEVSYKKLNGVLRVFKDGQLINTWTGIILYNGNKKPADKIIKIGYHYNNGQDCYIDEVLIMQECLHTTNFTPPTSAYEVSIYYWLAKAKTIPSYWSYKTNSWVDVGLPTTDADIATLFINQGTNTCPTQQQLELLGTGVNRPNRCCYQPVVATQPTININAVPTGKTVKPTELLPISSIEGIDSVAVANTVTAGTVKLAVTLDLVTYYKFNGSAWEVIDINTNQANMMDITTVTSINRSQWDLLTNGTASGIAFAYYLDISGIGDIVKIDKTSLVVDMKGEWNSAIKGTDFRYGYPANDRLKVTLLTTGNYKINYVGG